MLWTEGSTDMESEAAARAITAPWVLAVAVSAKTGGAAVMLIEHSDLILRFRNGPTTGRRALTKLLFSQQSAEAHALTSDWRRERPIVTLLV